MTVGEAIEALMEFPLETTLVICGHEFQRDQPDLVGWHIAGFEPTQDQSMVMIEGVEYVTRSEGSGDSDG